MYKEGSEFDGRPAMNDSADKAAIGIARSSRRSSSPEVAGADKPGKCRWLPFGAASRVENRPRKGCEARVNMGGVGEGVPRVSIVGAQR